MQLSALSRLPNQEGIAKAIGVSVQTIIKWEKEGMPVAFRRGQFVLYDKREIDDWLKKHRRRETRRSVWRSAGHCSRAGAGNE